MEIHTSAMIRAGRRVEENQRQISKRLNHIDSLLLQPDRICWWMLLRNLRDLEFRCHLQARLLADIHDQLCNSHWVVTTVLVRAEIHTSEALEQLLSLRHCATKHIVNSYPIANDKSTLIITRTNRDIRELLVTHQALVPQMLEVLSRVRYHRTKVKTTYLRLVP